MQRNNMFQIGLAVLVEDAGITSKTAEDLLSENPQCSELLPIMRRARIFDNPVPVNKTIFANLYRAVKALSENHAKSADKTDPVESLLSIYRFLGGDDYGNPCLLTADIHATILNALLDDYSLRTLASILSALQPLNQQIVNQLFTSITAYCDLFNLLHKLDPTDAGFLYLMASVKDAEQIVHLHEYLQIYAMMDEKKPWLNKTIFRIIVDNISVSNVLMSGFHHLNKVSMDDQYLDRFLQNPVEINQTLNQLQFGNMLTIEYLPDALSNPGFGEAVELCEKLGFIGWGGKVGDKATFMCKLLRHVELTQAICLLSNVVAKNPKTNTDELKKDLQLLLDSSHILTREPEKSSLKRGLSDLFSHKKHVEQPCLADCVAILKVKYEMQIEPASVAVAMKY